MFTKYAKYVYYVCLLSNAEEKTVIFYKSVLSVHWL